MDIEAPRCGQHLRFPSCESLNEEQNEEIVEKKLKLGYCEVCNTNEARYTCPRCEVKTCSLRCATIHKTELECDGKQFRAKFIPVKQFTNFDLSSDYRLLEEISRSVANSKKQRCIFNKSLQGLPHHLLKLKKSLETKKTTIKFLPFNFQRHQRNSTKLNFHQNVVFWHIEWIFTNADNLHIHDEQVRETERLGKVLRKYFNQQENKALDEKLMYYQAAGLTGVKLLLRAEGKKGLKFYELDPTLTLAECFRGKIIIEYPVIQIVLKDHSQDMQVIDTDDEDGTENNKFGNHVVDRIVKRAESDESLYASMRNMLFISEHSDGEEIIDDDNMN